MCVHTKVELYRSAGDVSTTDRMLVVPCCEAVRPGCVARGEPRVDRVTAIHDAILAAHDARIELTRMRSAGSSTAAARVRLMTPAFPLA